MIERRYTWRILLLSILVLAAWVGLGIRLAFLHLGEGDELRERVLLRRRIEQKIRVGRGRILDRNGEALAMDLAVKTVCVAPREVIEKGHVRFVAAHLARLLNLDPDRLVTRINRPRVRGMYVKQFVRPEVAESIAAMQLTGVYFEDASARYYPQNELMAHVVGFANAEGVGSAGVEQRMNRYLRGSPGLLISEKDGRHRELYGRRLLDIAPREGAEVQLTLDVTAQYIVEKALDRAYHEHHAEAAWALIERIRTGEILAMASRPSYNLNDYRKSTGEQRRNRAISVNYEPGSTFKVAIIAAALNEGVVTPDQVIDCENGYWVYNHKPLRDYHAHGKLTVADVLKKSSNIGAAKVALMLGPERVERYLRQFGIGRRTGIQLPGEESGILHGRRHWSGISITRIAMGHEVAVTALQMLNLVAAIANNGFLMKPYVIRRIIDDEGRTLYEAQPEVMGRPIRADTAATMRKLLRRITEEGGTGRRAALDDYAVAGKTGTAQKLVNGTYSSSANVASFVGFLPAEDPELGIIVVVDNPQPLHTGGRVAAPVFKEIAEQVMRYFASRPEEDRSQGIDIQLQVQNMEETS